MPVEISASLLSADLTALGKDVRDLEAAGAHRLHFDIMDGHFVPNLTFGAGFLQALRPISQLIFEAHLMVTPVDPYLEICAQAGADIILIHPEAEVHLHRAVQKIKDFGKKAGIVLNPTTSIDCLTYLLDEIDQILVMTVNPGFAGQKFLPSQLHKIKKSRDLINGRPIDLAVDGGITPQTAKQVIEAGANVLVAGTAIFQNRDLKVNIQNLRTP